MARPPLLAQPPASVHEVDAPASSGVISSSLLSCSAFSSQVTVDPTRYGTGGDMPLAEAITQLSFLEFLQRCGASIALPQPSRPSASISLRDVTVQTTPPCDVSHQVSTQTSVQQDMLSCDVAVQTSFYGAHTLSLDAAAQTTSPSTLSQHVSTQMGSRSASSFSVDTSVQTPIRSAVQHDAATQLPLTEFFIGCIYSNSPLDRHPVLQSPPPMQGSHDLPQPPPGLAQPVPPPELAAYSHLLTNVSSSSCHTQQSPVSTTPWSIFGQPNSNGLGPIATVDSDLMHQFRLSFLQWNPGPARRNPSNIVSAACGRFHAAEKQQMQSRIRKVATLARTGEKGRALAAARNAPPVPVTEQMVQEIKSLYPADPEPPAPASAPISALFLSEVAEQVPSTLRKMPRLSEPGPLGMRAEHWYDFGSLAGNSDLFVQVVAHIAAAAVPNSVLQYLRAGQITPLAKPTGGHRPLLMMSFLRRLALKSVMAAKKESVAKCAGPLQYGVGRPDGANTMINTIQYLAEADNSRVLVALDLKAAFQNVSRRAMLHSIAQTDTDLAAVFFQVVHRHHGAPNALRLCLHQNHCQQWG